MYDMSRYDRQILLESFGKEGQEKLKNGSVLIVGAGGLGSPAAAYLAGCGVGKIGIVDNDVVSYSNLHRQLLHSDSRIGMNKAISAKESLSVINPDIEIIAYPYCITKENAEEIISQYDFVIDAVDNFETKFLLNETCIKTGRPFCYGGVISFEGQCMTVVPDKGPCLQCVFEELPEPGTIPKADTNGILPMICGTIGTIQAAEAVKYLSGAGDLLIGRMFHLDMLSMKARIVNFKSKREDCPICTK